MGCKAGNTQQLLTAVHEGKMLKLFINKAKEMRNINVNRLLYRTGLRQLHLTWMMQIVQVNGENAVSRPIQISQY